MNRSSRCRAAAPLVVVVTMLAWSCNAIAQTEDPVDPPAPIAPATPVQVQETPTVVVDTPVVVVDEATGLPPATPATSVPAAPAAPAVTPVPDAPAAGPAVTTSTGVDAWTTGLAQWGTGLGIELLILGAGSIPLVGCVPQCLATCTGPFVVGIGEVGVGNAIGRRTGGWVWPVVGLFGARLALSVATTSLTFALLQREYVALFEATQSEDQSRVNAAQRALVEANTRNWPALLATSVGAAVLASAVPAVVYAFSAVDKAPGEPGAIAMPPPFAAAPTTTAPPVSSPAPVTSTMAW